MKTFIHISDEIGWGYILIPANDPLHGEHHIILDKYYTFSGIVDENYIIVWNLDQKYKGYWYVGFQMDGDEGEVKRETERLKQQLIEISLITRVERLLNSQNEVLLLKERIANNKIFVMLEMRAIIEIFLYSKTEETSHFENFNLGEKQKIKFDFEEWIMKHPFFNTISALKFDELFSAMGYDYYCSQLIKKLKKVCPNKSWIWHNQNDGWYIQRIR